MGQFAALVVPAAGGEGADEVGRGVWNVDGQGRDVGLLGFHGELGASRLSLFSLDRQRSRF